MRGWDDLRNGMPIGCREEWGSIAEALRLRRVGSRKSWLILANGFGKTIGLKCRGVCPNGLFGSADLGQGSFAVTVHRLKRVLLGRI